MLSSFKDLGCALKLQNNTPLKYGSEFRPVETLQPLLKNHPLWGNLSTHLKQGVEFPLRNTKRHEKLQDVMEALEFRNHKGVKKYASFFEENLDKNVRHGFCLPIPLQRVKKIENALLAPMNVVEQDTINEQGEIIDKKKITHNQSKNFQGSGTLVNSRVQEDDLQDCMYGLCLLRIIHAIVEQRRRHPNSKIFFQKIDFKSAYRRLHLGWKTAIQTITQYANIVFISLRLTFGGYPNTSIWGDVSETTCDLAHAILNHPDWEPETLFSPIISQVPLDKELPGQIPFAQALPTIVQVDINKIGTIDVYIDDIISAFPDLQGNRDRDREKILLEIHIMGFTL